MRLLIGLLLCLAGQAWAADTTPAVDHSVDEPCQTFDLDVGAQGNIELAASDALKLLDTRLPEGFKLLHISQHSERLEGTTIVFYTLLIEADTAGRYDFAFEFINAKGHVESRVPFHARIKGINER
jgi:hypothetical protein